MDPVKKPYPIEKTALGIWSLDFFFVILVYESLKNYAVGH